MPRADLILHGASQLLTCHADRPKRRGEMNDCGVLNGAAIEAALARGPAMGLSYVRLLTLLDMEAWIARWNGAGA